MRKNSNKKVPEVQNKQSIHPREDTLRPFAEAYLITHSLSKKRGSQTILNNSVLKHINNIFQRKQKVTQLAPPHSWEVEAATPESSGLQPGFMSFDFMHHNLAYPPQTLTRSYSGGTFSASMDLDIVNANDYQAMRSLLEGAHDSADGFISGTLIDSCVSFRDPFVFLLHSNVDRLFAGEHMVEV